MVMFHDRRGTLTTLSNINCILHVLLRYFHLTNFFWMFVEGKPKLFQNYLQKYLLPGLYLFLQVAASLSAGRLKLRHAVCIGWGE